MCEVIDNYTKDKSHSTQLSYRNSYNRMNHLLECPCENCSSDDIIKCLTNCDMPINSKLNLLNVVIVLARQQKPLNFSFNKIEKFRSQLQEKALAHKIETNKSLGDELPSLNQLNNYIKNLYDEKKYEEYAINYLLLHFSCRNTDMLIRIIKSAKDIIPELNYNYLLLRPSYVEFRRFNYKTASTYGVKNKRFKSIKLSNALNNIIDKRGDDGSAFLLLNNDGEPYVENNIGAPVRRMTFNEIGEGNYLKVILQNNNLFLIYLQQKEPHLVLNKLRAISENRGTSLEVLCKDYNVLVSPQ